MYPFSFLFNDKVDSVSAVGLNGVRVYDVGIAVFPKL